MNNSPLPIFAIQNAFSLAISKAHVVVESATGSGKSTQLPVWCMQSGTVLIVGPRRLDCLSLAKYVAKLSNTPLGDKIGYTVRFDDKSIVNTKAHFITPGVALRWLVENKLEKFNVIINRPSTYYFINQCSRNISYNSWC